MSKAFTALIRNEIKLKGDDEDATYGVQFNLEGPGTSWGFCFRMLYYAAQGCVMLIAVIFWLTYLSPWSR